jgi:hypothetical protein
LQLQLFLLCITCTDTPFRDSICTAPPNFFYFIFHSSKAFMNFRLVLKSKQRKKGKYQPAARIKRGSVEEKQYPSSRDVSEWFLLGSGFQAAREEKRKKAAVQYNALQNTTRSPQNQSTVRYTRSASTIHTNGRKISKYSPASFISRSKTRRCSSQDSK